MILRKPYAFLIKSFKTIHIILVVIMAYLLYRSNIVLDFFQNYISSNQMLTGKDFTGTLFSFNMFLFPFIVIIASIILLSVMYYKKKPFVYYVTNIIIYIIVLIVYNIAFSTAGTLETQIMDIRNVRLVRDIVMMLMLAQAITVILTFIRATGFDIKKFNFGQDLQELDIKEEDNEEFELNINIETNVIHRDINKNIRFARYVYLENRFLINIVFLLTISALSFIIYMNLTVYNKTYNENEMFSATEFNMAVSKSYITNKDYKGNKITDNYLVVVELNLKSKYQDISLNTAKSELVIGNKEYYHTNKYRTALFDLGRIYQGENISLNFEKIVLVYEIPIEQKNQDMLFRYIDTIEFGEKELNPKYIKTKLNPFDLDKENELKVVEPGEMVELNKNVLGNTKIYLTNFDIKNHFIIDYKFCPVANECYNSKEYIRPLANTNYDKSILKLSGILDKDQEIIIPKVYNIYTIIKYFGSITYEINGSTKTQNIGLNELKPTKANAFSNSYIEVIQELEKANSVKLHIKIRNNSYEYTLK